VKASLEAIAKVAYLQNPEDGEITIEQLEIE
jgi:hypothetical protein